MIPITKPYFSDEEEKIVVDIVRSGWVSQGPKVLEFEKKFAKYVGSPQAIAVSSCTTGLFLALKVAGIKAGDEVICPSYSFIATPNSIMHIGAIPKFVDIDPVTHNISPDLIEKTITRKTRAIMAVHQVGLAADMDRINKIAKKNNLLVIEDAACAIGSQYKGKRIGSGDNIACFSFHPRKILVAGEGGMITTNNRQYAERLKRLRHQGMSISDLERHKSKKVIRETYPELGYNFRMTDLQAALGITQFAKLDSMIKKRRVLAAKYNEAFSKIEELTVLVEPEYAKHNYQSYILGIKKASPVSRDELMSKLLEKGIATRRGIMASHRELFYKKLFANLSLPNTEYATDNTLIIPLYPGLTDDEQDYIINQIQNFTKETTNKV